MTNEEIIQGNKLIAEFMELKAVSIGSQISDTHDNLLCAYHLRWDWLMPVVEKIEKIYDEHHGYFGVNISSNSCSIQGTNLWKAIGNSRKYGYVYMSDPNAVLETKIKSTWYNIVEFIKWYNKNK